MNSVHNNSESQYRPSRCNKLYRNNVVFRVYDMLLFTSTATPEGRIQLMSFAVENSLVITTSSFYGMLKLGNLENVLYLTYIDY